MNDSRFRPPSGTVSTADARQIHVVPRFESLRPGVTETIDLVTVPHGDRLVHLHVNEQPLDVEVKIPESSVTLQPDGTGQTKISAVRERRLVYPFGKSFDVLLRAWTDDGKMGETKFTLKMQPLYAMFIAPALIGVLLVAGVLLNRQPTVDPTLTAMPGGEVIITATPSPDTGVTELPLSPQPFTSPPPGLLTNTPSAVPTTAITVTDLPTIEPPTATPTACIKTIDPNWVEYTVPEGATLGQMFGVNVWYGVMIANCIPSDKEVFAGMTIWGPPQ